MHKPSLAIVSAAAASLLLAWSGYAAGQETKPKYYFNIGHVRGDNQKVVALAKELLVEEVASRPEFTSELGGAQGQAALAEIRKRKLEGYEVSMRITSVTQEDRPPAPGRLDRQMAIDVSISVLGASYVGNKVRFTGDGSSSLMGEYSERRKDKDVQAMLKTALAAAIKQAVSNAALKLSSETPALGAPKKRSKAKAKKR